MYTNDILKSQFNIVWKLGSEYILKDLTLDMCLWKPVDNVWTVTLDDNNNWVADFLIPEPTPLPSCTIGWLTWHILWWWSNTLASLDGQPVREHKEFYWFASTDVLLSELQKLHDRWIIILDTYNLEDPCSYPWGKPKTFGDTFAWVNIELMKNFSEIGYIKNLYLNKFRL